MQFSAVLATLLLASSAVSIALPQELDDSTAIAGNGTTVLEDGVEPAFDPQELTLDESTVQVEGRGLDEEKTLERRSPASSIVDCAKKLKGTKYLFGGCKSTSPFGPVKGGMDCSCLSRTCVKKGTGTTIPRTTKTQYPTKAGKCHQINRSSAKAGDLVFWGCGQSGGIHHVAIVSKPGYIIHAPHTGDVVREAKIWKSGICAKAVRCW